MFSAPFNKDFQAAKVLLLRSQNMKGMILFIEHDDAPFFNNENAGWSARVGLLIKSRPAFGFDFGDGRLDQRVPPIAGHRCINHGFDLVDSGLNAREILTIQFHFDHELFKLAKGGDDLGRRIQGWCGGHDAP
jgi:hypothetical protein